MSKISAALGISSKGSVTVVLERSTWQPGETVVGQVTLRVNEAFNVKALSMVFHGEERLKWEQIKNMTTAPFKALIHPNRMIEGEPHERTPDLAHQHLVIAESLRCEPGDYVFPFEFALPVDLPGTCENREYCISGMINVHARVKYTSTVSVLEAGAPQAELSVEQVVRVVPGAAERPQISGSQWYKRRQSVRIVCQGTMQSHSDSHLKHGTSQ